MSEEITLDEIKAIIELIRQNESITSFSFKYGDVEISLARGDEHSNVPVRSAASGPSPAAPRPQEAPPLAAAAPKPKVDVKPGPGEVAVTSPMVGTFYRCPKPGDPPFVEVGTAVNEDTVLCIIEVMKLMNSLEAKMKGVVMRILVEDSQPVEFGQPLMLIKPEAS
jgi:acetyl-CoA carboxylase biotin carboxyl carrier protein